MQNPERSIVILGTGGTIAGTAVEAGDTIGYRAAQLGVASLVRDVPGLAGQALETEQVAQLDSKDMDYGVWQALARRCAHHLARPEVGGLVITHGTDTLEETAYLLQRVLAPSKPVVLTAAMRPASALHPDGPQNLLDALRVANEPGARGVLAVLGGTVHPGAEVRKSHTYRLDAFCSGDAGPLAYVEAGQLRRLREWPQGEGLGLDLLEPEAADWPWVELVSSHAGADGRVVSALQALGVQGLVVLATGNGTVHERLEAALVRARAAGVKVWRSTRCAQGRVLAKPGDLLPDAGALTPFKARVEVLLQLLLEARRQHGA
ncbi:asparaginase [Aquabacterium sp. A7-Y]|uniref:AbASNase2 n=1 Tax=Aquabacterium sp. A7-Y TaxID=1349605 RepID=A0A182BSR6_9BURK|nr:asparaginase [Aquabacterium sp. A7-Y]ANC70284.1 abASNase2 [Aquabacterium sp. A7-Y]MCW7541235.1 asparaginase [Aquabacterium sp. A7-Y]